MLGKQVSEVLVSESGTRTVRGVRLASGETVEGDVYVSALPFHTVPSVLPAGLNEDPFFAGIGRLAAAPIVNVHIWYDREVMEPSSPPFIAFVDSPLHWVFDKRSILGLSGTGDGSASDGSTSASRSAARGTTPTNPRRRYAGCSPRRWPRRSPGAGRPGQRAAHRQIHGDLPLHSRIGPAAPPQRDAGGQPVPGRRLDGHGMAVHDGERGTQRRRRRTGHLGGGQRCLAGP